MNLLNPKRGRFLLLLGTFLTFMVILAPQIAMAQDDCDPTPEGDVGAKGDYVNRYLHNVHSAIQKISQVKHDHLHPNNLRIVNARLDYCIDKISEMLDLVMTITNPTKLLMTLFNAFLNGVIIALIDEACKLITDLLTIGINFITGVTKICIPIPKLHVPGFAFNWHGSCHGGIVIQPIELGRINPTGQKEKPNGWQIWNGSLKTTN